MKKLSISLLSLLFAITLQAQRNSYYYSIADAMENKDSVYNITIREAEDFNQLEKLLEFPNLESVGMHDTETIPEILKEIPNLKTLTIGSLMFSRDIAVSELPEWLPELGLEELRLFWLPLPEVPSIIGEMTTLKRLDIYGIQSPSFPEFLSNLRILEELSLFGSQFNSIPESMAAIESLRMIDIAGTKIEHIPNAFLSENRNGNPLGVMYNKGQRFDRETKSMLKEHANDRYAVSKGIMNGVKYNYVMSTL